MHRIAVSVVVAFMLAPVAAQAQTAPEKLWETCISNWRRGPSGAEAIIELAVKPDSKRYVANDLDKVGAHLEAVAAQCEAECKGATPPDRLKDRVKDTKEDNAAWCKAAADRKALLRRSVVNGMKSWKGMHDTVEPDKIKEEYTTKEGYWSEFNEKPQDLATRRKERRDRYAREGYEKQWKYVGMTDAEIDAVVDETMGFEVARWKVLEELAATFTFPKKGNKDKKLEGLAKTAVTKSIKGAKVLATVMQEKDYKVKTNNLGVPVERWKDGSILFQVPGEKFCRQEGFTYTEAYNGKKYTPSPSVRLNLWRYIDCKNIK